MSTILALVNAHALAHVSRPLEIAKVLRDRRCEITFGGHGKYLDVAANSGFDVVNLPYIPVQQVVNAVRAQRLGELYVEEQITEYIDAELDIYRQLRPELVLIDNRPTASISAESAKIKTVSIVNVHMSHWKAIPFHSIRNVFRAGAWPPFKYLDRVEVMIEEFFVDRFVMGDMRKTRRRLGLKKKVGFENEQGDLNLLPDIPQFNPVVKLPKSAHYVGPLTWHNDLPPPGSLEKIGPERRCIYFTVGSEGLEELVENVGVLSNDERPIIISTGEAGSTAGLSLPSHVHLEKFVNADAILPRCDLVVCHGGNGTIYQALGHGVPIVGIATHEEQYYGLKRVTELGLGIGLRAKVLKKRGIQLLLDAIREVLADGKYRNNALHFQKLISQYGNGAENAAALIEDFIATAG